MEFVLQALASWSFRVLVAATFLSYLGMYLGTTFLSVGSALMLVVGAPFLLVNLKGLIRHPVFKPFMFFLLTVGLSICFAEPYPFLKPFLKLRYFLCLLVSSLVFTLVPSLRKVFLRASWWIAPVFSILAILQYLKLFNPLKLFFGTITPVDATGLLTHHTAFGLSMVFVFHLIVSQVKKSRSRSLRWFLVVSASLCVIAVVCSLSRGAIVALVFSVLVVFLSGRSLKAGLMMLGLILLVCTLPLILSAPSRERLTRLDRTVFKDRLSLLSFGWEEFRKHPLMGHGFARFPFELAKYPQKKEDTGEHGHSHNVYLDLLAGTGVLGFLGFIWIVLVMSKSLLKNLRKCRGSGESEEKREWLLGISGVWYAFLAGCLFDEYLLWSQILIPTMTIMGSAFEWPQPESLQRMLPWIKRKEME